MKKVRIMLSALVVIAAVGGVLAFKAKDNTFCYYEKNQAGDACLLVGAPIETYSTAATEPQHASVIDFVDPCPPTQPLVNCNLRITTTTID